MIVKKAKPLAVECVVRGYLAGSGWKEYRDQQTVCGIKLPPGLKESSELPAPIFTPATKAESGHDENIPFAQAAEMVGAGIAEQARAASLKIYRLRPRLRPKARHYHCRHQIRVRPARRQTHPD